MSLGLATFISGLLSVSLRGFATTHLGRATGRGFANLFYTVIDCLSWSCAAGMQQLYFELLLCVITSLWSDEYV